jgi:hypothetical protein
MIETLFSSFESQLADIESDYFRLNNALHHSNSHLTAMKKQIVSLVETMLPQLNELSLNSPNRFPFSSAHAVLYDLIKKSNVLNIHKFPRLDDKLGITITNTQQKILGMIRGDALHVFRSRVQSIAAMPDDDDCANLKYINNSIDGAMNSQLFCEHRSNLPSFFRPKVTNSVKELNELKDSFQAKIAGKLALNNLLMGSQPRHA